MGWSKHRMKRNPTAWLTDDHLAILVQLFESTHLELALALLNHRFVELLLLYQNIDLALYQIQLAHS